MRSFCILRSAFCIHIIFLVSATQCSEVEQFAVTLVNSKTTWLSPSVVVTQVNRFTHQVCFANYCTPHSAFRAPHLSFFPCECSDSEMRSFCILSSAFCIHIIFLVCVAQRSKVVPRFAFRTPHSNKVVPHSIYKLSRFRSIILPFSLRGRVVRIPFQGGLWVSSNGSGLLIAL